MDINNIKVTANNSRNPFPLEQQIVDSAKPGLCQLVYCRDTVPDSVYKLDVGAIMETTTLNTNAFVRGSQNIEFFFVPYSQLYGDFMQMYAGKGEHLRVPNRSSLNSDKSLPRLQLADYMMSLFLLWLNGRSMTPSQTDTRIIDWNVTAIELRAHNIFGRPVISDVLRLLDCAGYGNLEPLFQEIWKEITIGIEGHGYEPAALSQYQHNWDAFINEVLPEFTFIPDSFIPDHDKLETVDVKDYLCLRSGWSYITQWEGHYGVRPRSFSVMRLAAYQKVWNDYYRNKIYDIQDYAEYFNFDFVAYSSSKELSTYDVSYFWKLTTPRFHQWKKDVYTGNFPSAQFGDVAFQQVSDGTLSSSRFDPNGDSAVFVDASGKLINEFDSTSAMPLKFNGVGISATDIRYTMALQRYRERLLRTGNRLKDIQKGIFGDSSRFIMDDYSVMLGAFRGSFEINKVAATTETTSVDIGQLGAFGTGSLTGKEITFNCHDHGVIVGIYYFLPETEYNSVMIDPFNTKLQSDDFFKPDFENLGLSPVYGFELDAALGSKVIGYGARYHEYKTAVDLVRGVFGSYHSRWKDSHDNYREYHSYLPFADYAAPRDLTFMRDNDIARYYIDPECLNTIFKVSVNSQFRDTDPFKLAMYFNVRAVQPMSVTGLPQL